MAAEPVASPRPFPAHIPFVEQLGLQLLHAAEGESGLAVDIAGMHLNSHDVAHGGVLMTLLDVAMAQAARTLHREGESHGPSLTTVEMKTSFLRPGTGQRLTARGRVLHRTATMAFCEASAYDATDRLCAHATGTFKYVRASKTERKLP